MPFSRGYFPFPLKKKKLSLKRFYFLRSVRLPFKSTFIKSRCITFFILPLLLKLRRETFDYIFSFFHFFFYTLPFCFDNLIFSSLLHFSLFAKSIRHSDIIFFLTKSTKHDFSKPPPPRVSMTMSELDKVSQKCIATQIHSNPTIRPECLVHGV